jgi:hypothetical protein
MTSESNVIPIIVNAPARVDGIVRRLVFNVENLFEKIMTQAQFIKKRMNANPRFFRLMVRYCEGGPEGNVNINPRM